MNISEKIQLEKLLHRYLDGKLDEEEAVLMHQLLQKPDAQEVLTGISVENTRLSSGIGTDASWDVIWQNITRHISLSKAVAPPVRRMYSLRKWSWAAASIILFLAIGLYLWTSNKGNTLPPTVATNTVDTASHQAGVFLTLADGSRLALDSLKNGMIANQNGVQVTLENGQLAYAPTGNVTAEMMYNTISIPKGRQFQVALPDGTQVWLNAASSIQYPIVFAGKEREVTVIGEAYFEVAQNSKMPFLVNVNNRAAIEVLGTHFNVNAYENEADIYTTLMEGSVRIINGLSKEKERDQVILQPRQQAQITGNRLSVIDHADIAKVIAWKNGVFNFGGVGFQQVMRQVERWYNVEVQYEGLPPSMKINGEMDRGVKLSGLLRILSAYGIAARLEGNVLVIKGN